MLGYVMGIGGVILCWIIIETYLALTDNFVYYQWIVPPRKDTSRSTTLVAPYLIVEGTDQLHFLFRKGDKPMLDFWNDTVAAKGFDPKEIPEIQKYLGSEITRNLLEAISLEDFRTLLALGNDARRVIKFFEKEVLKYIFAEWPNELLTSDERADMIWELHTKAHQLLAANPQPTEKQYHLQLRGAIARMRAAIPNILTVGFTPEEAERISTWRDRVENGTYSDVPLEHRHLDFIRWLYINGKLEE